MPRRTFSKEFKRMIVQRVWEGERTAAIAAELGVRYTLIDKWRRAIEDEQEEAQCKERENAELERLRDVEFRYQTLKKQNSELRVELQTANRRLHFLIDTFKEVQHKRHD